MSAPVAIAVAAHPDDIEFQMAGTLLLLQKAGWEIHYMNLSTGNCGSTTMTAAQTRVARRKEAKAAASILGATWHAPIADDLEIFYTDGLLRKLASVFRKVKPNIVLTHSPQDYMEDHMNTSRLAVTAAFTRGMPNYQVQPQRQPTNQDVAVYHAMPHGLRDGLRRRIIPELFVNVTSVHATKLEALAAHESQQAWLDSSQGMNSYLQTMEDLSREIGTLSKGYRLAEGWRRHSHLGFSTRDEDPLRLALKRSSKINPVYKKRLEQGI